MRAVPMRTDEQRRAIIPCTILAVLLLGASPSAIKDPVGVYGVIDRVVFEPVAGNAERVQVWGVFALAHTFDVRDGKIERIDMRRFRPAVRGYLYYTVNAEDAAGTRSEWAVLAAAAGTGAPVSFGSRAPPAVVGSGESRMSLAAATAMAEVWERYNGRVRPARERPAAPDAFPHRPARGSAQPVGRRPHPVSQVMRVPEPVSPADGAEVDGGRVRLVARNVHDSSVSYVFEIERPDGTRETSAPIAAGEATTAWSPDIRLQNGETYVWRVRVVRPDGTLFPNAEAVIRVRN